MKVHSYAVTLRHDGGKCRIKIVGSSVTQKTHQDRQRLRSMICDMEGCPEHAIESVRKTNAKIRM